MNYLKLAGRILFAIPLVVFGLGHLMNADAMAGWFRFREWKDNFLLNRNLPHSCCSELVNAEAGFSFHDPSRSFPVAISYRHSSCRNDDCFG